MESLNLLTNLNFSFQYWKDDYHLIKIQRFNSNNMTHEILSYEYLKLEKILDKLILFIPMNWKSIRKQNKIELYQQIK